METISSGSTTPKTARHSLSLLTIGEEEHLKIDKKLTALIVVMPIYQLTKLNLLNQTVFLVAKCTNDGYPLVIL